MDELKSGYCEPQDTTQPELLSLLGRQEDAILKHGEIIDRIIFGMSKLKLPPPTNSSDDRGRDLETPCDICGLLEFRIKTLHIQNMMLSEIVVRLESLVG